MNLVEHFLDHHAPGAPRGVERLTARETEVLTLVGRGLSNDEIARELAVSHNTLKTHISSLLSKLGARDRAQLVITAYEQQLVALSIRGPND